MMAQLKQAAQVIILLIFWKSSFKVSAAKKSRNGCRNCGKWQSRKYLLSFYFWAKLTSVRGSSSPLQTQASITGFMSEICFLYVSEGSSYTLHKTIFHHRICVGDISLSLFKLLLLLSVSGYFSILDFWFQHSTTRQSMPFSWITTHACKNFCKVLEISRRFFKVQVLRTTWWRVPGSFGRHFIPAELSYKTNIHVYCGRLFCKSLYFVCIL